MDCKCRLCNNKLSKKIYELANMPAFVQNMSETKDASGDSIDLDLYECPFCGLIQFSCDPVYYYKDVIRAVGLSDTLKKLRIVQYENLFSKYSLNGKKVWEVGCGGGEFLRLWDGIDIAAYGVENSDSLVSKALSEGLNVQKGYVDSGYIDPNGPFDAFTSFNYLEHQPNPSEWIRGIYNNLCDEAVGLITVPSFEYFIEKASYYEFMRDHIAYYTETALTNLFLLNGFTVEEIGRFNGDTTYVIVKKRPSVTIPDFEKQRVCLETAINQFAKDNSIEEMAVWGASHQAFTLLATLKLDFNIPFIVDSSPFKWGKYSPVSHFPIVSPEHLYSSQVRNVLIMAPAFSKEIFNSISQASDKIEHVIAVKDDVILHFK